MIKKKTFLAAGAFAAMATAASAQLTLPITDTFSTVGSPDQSWIDPNGAYTEVEAFAPTAPGGDGFAMNINDGSGYQLLFLADDDGSLSDYRVTAQIYVADNTTSWSRFGIIVRADSVAFTPDCIYFQVDSDGDDFMRVSKRDGGSYSTVQLLPDTYTTGAWHEMSVEAEGTEIRAYFDGVEVYNSTTFGDTIGSDYTSGRIALFNYLSGSIGAGGSPTYVDRVTIEELNTSVDDWSLF